MKNPSSRVFFLNIHHHRNPTTMPSKPIQHPGKNFAANDKRKVWNGQKERTRSGLTKKDLMERKHDGQIISRRKHSLGVKLMNRQD
jgi:hypothetical protein